jgi:hypothetical protein
MQGRDQLLTIDEVSGPPNGYISEAEVKHMLFNYNRNLAQLSFQVDELTRRNQQLEKSLITESSKYSRLEEDYDSLVLNLQATNTRLQDAQFKIHTLETSLSAIHNRENPSIASKILEDLSSFPLPDSHLSSLKSSLTQLIQDNATFYAENKSLKSLSEEKLKKDLLQLRCKHCRKLFLQPSNHSEACEYHSGKLKFYSCKGCGCDAYYTCCNRCNECSRGCKLGRHIPTDNYL